ncbi:hemicentin-1-like [Ptychodera flava]|uniref:hemicentin-1-like n=1 Tax=Ptychodera flava TaxID=63121 RepID=UPI003969DB2C
MTTSRCWFALCFLFLASFHYAHSQQSFLVEPSSVSVLEDDDHTLQCSVSDKEGVVIWQKDGEPLNSDYILNSGVSSNIYEVEAPTNVGVEYNLIIKSVTSEEAGTYTCTVTAAGSSSNLVSSAAIVTVILKQTISQTPSARDEKLSDTITLQCVAENKVGSLEWYRQDDNQDLVKISTETSVVTTFSDRYSIVGDQDNGEYILEIRNLQYSDAGEYSCHLTEEGVQGQVWSSPAELTVIAAISPDQNYPECELVPQGELSEGDNVTLICRSQYGDPPATLEWGTSTGLTLPSVTVESTGGGQVREDTTLILGREHNGAIFNCSSSHVTHTQTKRCTVGPLYIDLMQRIRVDIYPALVEVEEGDSTTVTCNATAIDDSPDVVSYTWRYESDDITDDDERFIIETGSMSTLHILSGAKSMDSAIISCLAESPVDAQLAIASIKILEPTLFGLSYTLLVVVVAFIVAIILAIILIAIIIYCVWKKRQQKEDMDEDEKVVVEHQVEQATVSMKVGSGNESITPYGRDNKYDYYMIKREGRRHRSGRHNEVVPLGSAPLDRSLPPIPKATFQVPEYQNIKNDKNIYDEIDRRDQRRRRHRRRRRRHDDDDDDDYDHMDDHKHSSRRSRSESRGRHEHSSRSKRRSRRRRDRDDDDYRSRSEPPRSRSERSSDRQRSGDRYDDRRRR